MNIALFGGSFDPFHIGHEKIVESILKYLQIDKLFIVPTYINPFKDNYFLSPEIRFELLENLYMENKKIDIIRYEIEQKRKVSTIETLEYLVSKYDLDKIYLVIGADNFKTIERWNSFNQLEKMVEFVVFGRDGHSVDDVNVKHKFIQINFPISSTDIRETKNISLIPTKIQKRMKTLWMKE